MPAQLPDDRSERKSDRRQDASTLGRTFSRGVLVAPLALLGAGLAVWRGGELWLVLALSFGLLGLLHGLRNRISIEAFRVFADATLVLGALYALGFTGSVG